MRIEKVDLFYLSMPEIRDEGDGSQDALLVRVRAGGFEGWGECEAAPLPSIAAYCCPPSHGFCKPVRNSVEGQRIDSTDDIRAINAEARRVGLDLLQTDHMLSGVDIALWDLLGKARELPVYQLLGDRVAYPKLPYASVLFGETPEETYNEAVAIRERGFTAAKFGWGGFGVGTPQADLAHARAAREGLGDEATLLLDAGTVWGDDLERASATTELLAAVRPTWLEEPFLSEAQSEYRSLVDRFPSVPLAAGEGAHSYLMARRMALSYGLSYLQIDAGRIGGITAAYQVRELCCSQSGLKMVNHTFTSHLALSASLQPYAGVEKFQLAEYPIELKPLARDLTTEQILPGADGLIRLPELPGLGLTPSLETVRQYLVPVRIEIGGKMLFESDEV